MEDKEKTPTIKLRIRFSGKPPEGAAASPPTCSLCSRSFFSVKALHGHMRSHRNAPPPPAPPSPPRPTDLVGVLPPRPQPPRLSWSRTEKRTPRVPFEAHPEVFDEREEGKDAAGEEPPSKESCADAGAVAASEGDPGGALEQCGQTREPSESPPCACDCCRRWQSTSPCGPAPPAPSFVCGPCGKTFPSYHALCGHMASHPKQQHDPLSLRESYHCYAPPVGEGICSEVSKTKRGVKRAKPAEHRCNVCGKVFPTGQALGGHKRLHWEGPKSCPTLLLPPPPPPPPAAAAPGDFTWEKATPGRTHAFDLNEMPLMVEDGDAANLRELLLLVERVC